MLRMIDLPAWQMSLIEDRAKALDVSFDEALTASLNLRATDPMAQTAGWAVIEMAQTPRRVARRLRYAQATIRSAARRWMDQRTW